MRLVMGMTLRDLVLQIIWTNSLAGAHWLFDGRYRSSWGMGRGGRRKRKEKGERGGEILLIKKGVFVLYCYEYL